MSSKRPPTQRLLTRVIALEKGDSNRVCGYKRKQNIQERVAETETLYQNYFNYNPVYHDNDFWRPLQIWWYSFLSKPTCIAFSNWGMQLVSFSYHHFRRFWLRSDCLHIILQACCWWIPEVGCIDNLELFEKILLRCIIYLLSNI